MSEREDADGGDRREEALDGIESLLGYKFRERKWLVRALTHASHANERGGRAAGALDNERLEFLGDAVLGLVISDILFRSSGSDEGLLTRTKSFLVNAKMLADLARDYQIGKYLRLGRGEEKDSGRAKESLQADAFEAIIGAVYLDGGIRAARSFVKRAFGEHLKKLQPEKLLRNDYKSYLQELLQSWELPLPRYRVRAESGPDHNKVFTVEIAVADRILATGAGKSKKSAEQAAARKALKTLEGNGFDIRSLACDDIR